MQGVECALVSLRPGHLLPVVVQHGDIPPVVGAAEGDDLVLPMPLLAQELVDLVVQVSDLVVCQARCAPKPSLANQLEANETWAGVDDTHSPESWTPSD